MPVITENHLEHFYVPFSRVNQEEQTVEAYCYVNNKVKSDRWDMPREVLERSAELYMQMPAVREMHGNSAAGKATRLDWDAKGCKMTLKVVDPTAWQKVVENVYRGLSIGGRPELVRGNQIQKFDWVETSLVDRPADPDCKFTVVRLDSVETYDIEVLEGSEPLERVLESTDVPVRQNLEGKPKKSSKMPTCSDKDLIAAVGEVCFAPEQQEEIARGQSSRAKMKQGRARAKAQHAGGGGNFDETKHPRGNPKNKGEFGKGGGGSQDAPEDKSPVPNDSQADEQAKPGAGNEEPDTANPDASQAPAAPDGIPPEFHTTKVNTDHIAQVADKLAMPETDKSDLIQAQKEGKIQTAADLHGAITDIRDNNGGNTDPAGVNQSDPGDPDNGDAQPDENAPQVGDAPKVNFDDQDDNPDGVQPDNTDPANPEPTNADPNDPNKQPADPDNPDDPAAQEDTNSDTGNDTGDDNEDDNTAPVDDQDTAGTDADGDSESDTEQEDDPDPDPDPDNENDNSNTSDKVKQMKQHLAQMSVNLKASILKSLNFALDNASDTIDKMVESYRDGSDKGGQYAGIGRADVTDPEQKEELMGVLQRVCQAQADELNAEVDAILGAVTLEDFTAGEAEEKPVARVEEVLDEPETVPDKSEAYLQRIEALEDQMNKMSNVSLKRPFARADATAAEKVFGLNEGVSFGRASSSIDRDTLKKTKEAFVERAAAATTQEERTFCAFEITKIDSILGSIV